MNDQSGILPGTLDLLILKAASLGGLHGYGVLLRIEQIEGARQTVAGAGSCFHDETPVRELADLLPDRSARDAERPRELLAGVHAAVGQGM